jgi:hypothetical protein
VSFIDAVLSDTAGVAYRAFTGNVDPWTKAQIQDELTANLVRAQGLGDNATPEQIASASALAGATITDALLTAPDGGADPSQSTGLRVPGLGVVGSTDFLGKADKLVNGAIVIGLLIGAFYLYQTFGSTVQRTFRRR